MGDLRTGLTEGMGL